MKQPIAGVAPSQISETPVMFVWPSVSMFALGRLLGRLYAISFGGYIFTVGNFIALATAPIGALLYLLRVAPGIGRRYVLTNRRVVVQRGISFAEDKSIELDRFDSIRVDIRPGQAWFAAGDLIFERGGVETFRLDAVPRPETFRHTCLKSHHSYVGTRAALARG